MKGRALWFLLLFIGISWIANSLYAHSKQLDDPIFLDHYVDTTLQENVYLPLYYLTNLNDPTTISYVTIDGIRNHVIQEDFFSNVGFNHHIEHYQNLQTFTHHALRSIQLELNTFELENLLQDGKFTFSEIEVFFNDGKNITVPIGEITVHADWPNNESDVFHFVSGSGSSDGSNETTYQVTEDLSIDNISFNYDDILQEHLLIKIDSKNQGTTDNPLDTVSPQDWENMSRIDLKDIQFPYELEKDEPLHIYTQFSPDLIGYLESTVELSGTTKSGKTFTYSIWINSQQPYLNQKDINKMIEK